MSSKLRPNRYRLEAQVFARRYELKVTVYNTAKSGTGKDAKSFDLKHLGSRPTKYESSGQWKPLRRAL